MIYHKWTCKDCDSNLLLDTYRELNDCPVCRERNTLYYRGKRHIVEHHVAELTVPLIPDFSKVVEQMTAMSSKPLVDFPESWKSKAWTPVSEVDPRQISNNIVKALERIGIINSDMTYDEKIAKVKDSVVSVKVNGKSIDLVE